MDVECTDEALLIIGHEQGCDFVFLKDMDGLGGKNIGRGGPAVGVHYVAHFCLVNVRARIESAAQIPVRKDAENFVVAVDDRRHAEAFLRHFHEAISQIDV